MEKGEECILLCSFFYFLLSLGTREVCVGPVFVLEAGQDSQGESHGHIESCHLCLKQWAQSGHAAAGRRAPLSPCPVGGMATLGITDWSP